MSQTAGGIRELHDTRLREVPYEFSMLYDGNTGGHFGATTVLFARERLASVIRGTSQERSPALPKSGSYPASVP